MKRTNYLLACVALLGLILSGCGAGNGNDAALSASGTIRAEVVAISPEMNAKVVEVHVQEGQQVSEGDALFTQDRALLRAQADQTAAQVTAAQASLEAAEAQLATARVQLDQALQGARLQDSEARALAWLGEGRTEIDLPAWYFQKTEELDAARAEVDAATDALDREQAALARILASASSEDFVAAERRLAEADAAYATMSQALERARNAADSEALEEAAQERVDAARAELDAAKLAYNRLLTATAAQDVTEARARVAAAQARLDIAQITLAGLQTGEASLQVEGARAQVRQAETAIRQAEANLAQARAAERVVALQLERATVAAPLSGTVLARNLEVGEFAAAGSIAMTLARLDEVRLIVYVPEDRYGVIRLEQPVEVTVDSYPDRTFTGYVVTIADEAEFTPRNVSTVEGRKSTVFAVEVLLANPDGALKPGMPADVVFGE